MKNLILKEIGHFVVLNNYNLVLLRLIEFNSNKSHDSPKPFINIGIILFSSPERERERNANPLLFLFKIAYFDFHFDTMNGENVKKKEAISNDFFFF